MEKNDQKQYVEPTLEKREELVEVTEESSVTRLTPV